MLALSVVPALPEILNCLPLLSITTPHNANTFTYITVVSQPASFLLFSIDPLNTFVLLGLCFISEILYGGRAPKTCFRARIQMIGSASSKQQRNALFLKGNWISTIT